MLTPHNIKNEYKILFRITFTFHIIIDKTMREDKYEFKKKTIRVSAVSSKNCQ